MNPKNKKFIFSHKFATEFKKIFAKELPKKSIQELEKYQKECELIRKSIRIITIFLIVLGIFFSLYFQNWLIFSRFGSLIVIHAIIFSVFENKLTIKIQRLFKAIVTQEKQKAIQETRDFSEKILIGLRYEQTNDNLQNFLEQSFQIKFGGLELGILFIGTIIWGWGDFVGVLVELL